MNKIEEKPFVSIIVITYNSSKYVLETLESIKFQTLRNIELIVSDDGSKDDTVAICSKWIGENKDRFANAQLITVEKNTGIPGNCNRGIRVSKGEWVKIIAGDDAFYEDAMENFAEKTKLLATSLVVQTKMDYYKDNFSKSNFTGSCSPRVNFFNLPPNKQHEVLLLKYVCFTPSLFFRREIFEKFEFDEKYKLLEDYPFMLKLTFNNIKIDLIDITTVKYRLSEDSIQNKAAGKFFTVAQANVLSEVLKEYVQNNPYLQHLRLINLLNAYGMNKKNSFTKYLEMLFFKRLNMILVRKYKI